MDLKIGDYVSEKGGSELIGRIQSIDAARKNVIIRRSNGGTHTLSIDRVQKVDCSILFDVDDKVCWKGDTYIVVSTDYKAQSLIMREIEGRTTVTIDKANLSTLTKIID